MGSNSRDLYCYNSSISFIGYSKTCLKRPLKKKRLKLGFKTDYRLMQVKSIAECSTFIKLPFVIKRFVLSIFEWPLKTGFALY